MVSPFVSFITYSVLDGCRLIVTHERRHFEQARRVAGSRDSRHEPAPPHRGRRERRDDQDRGQDDRGEPGLPGRAVDRRARPADVDHHERAPQDGGDVDRKAEAPEREQPRRPPRRRAIPAGAGATAAALTIRYARLAHSTAIIVTSSTSFGRLMLATRIGARRDADQTTGSDRRLRNAARPRPGRRENGSSRRAPSRTPGGRRRHGPPARRRRWQQTTSHEQHAAERAAQRGGHDRRQSAVDAAEPGAARSGAAISAPIRSREAEHAGRAERLKNRARRVAPRIRRFLRQRSRRCRSRT